MCQCGFINWNKCTPGGKSRNDPEAVYVQRQEVDGKSSYLLFHFAMNLKLLKKIKPIKKNKNKKNEPE